MGKNEFASNSFTDWNFPKICLTDEFAFQLNTRPEKIAFLSLKIKAGDVKN
jgi:hypothetical protein